MSNNSLRMEEEKYEAMERADTCDCCGTVEANLTPYEMPDIKFKACAQCDYEMLVAAGKSPVRQ